VTHDGHVEAEALAAWAEGTLPRSEATAVEAHLSSCASCQEVLAVFARTSPGAAPAPAFWERWRLQWAVPIAAATTAAAIWVATPSREHAVDEFERTVTSAIEPTQPESNVPPAAAADSAAPVEAPAARPAPARPDAPAPSFADRAEKAENAETRERQEREQDLAAVPRAAPAAAPAAPSPAQATEQAPLRAEARADLARQVPPAEVISPDPLVRWRIVPPGLLERSTDAGKTWQSVSLQPALQSFQPIQVTAVLAPTATTAIVTVADGRRLRTDDQGKTWNPIPPP
jgi:hypothetical protein